MAKSASESWEPERSNRLESWKEIAACLQRQVRTVQLWEVMEAMPVHRHLHAKLCTVYAYKSELDNWLKTRVPRKRGRKQAWSGVTIPRSVTPQAKSSTSRIMLAVLPFVNVSHDPQQEYFSDGITDEIISQLGQLSPQHLGIIARTSTMKYKATNKSVEEVGSELGVEYVLEGGVRYASGRVRITAQLIQVEDQTHLWAESYEKDLADVFAIQDEVATCIADSLALELLPPQKNALPRILAGSSVAYVAYLKGRYCWNMRTFKGLSTGIRYFQTVVRNEPRFAQAHAGLADCYASLAEFGWVPPNEVMPKAKAAALKALEIDDTLAEAHTALAHAKFYFDWDWVGAETGFRRALELNPSYASAHEWFSDYLVAMGRSEEAIREAKLAQRLDPLSLIISTNLGCTFFYARQFERAVRQCLQTLDMDPNFWVAHWFLGCAYLQLGMTEKAVEALQDATALSGPLGWEVNILPSLVHAYVLLGRKADARKLAKKLMVLSKEKYISPLHIALACAGLGERDRAFEWLEKSYQERSLSLTLLKVNPRFDTLSSDRRFQVLVRRIGFTSQ